MSIPPKRIKHYLQFNDLSLEEYEYVIARAAEIKRKFKAYEIYHPLIDRTLVVEVDRHHAQRRTAKWEDPRAHAAVRLLDRRSRCAGSADLDARRDGQDHRGEVQDARDARIDETITHLLRGVRRSGDDADAGIAQADHVAQILEGAHAVHVVADRDRGSDDVGMGVDEPDDAEAAAGEPAVGHECAAEVADSDEHDAPRLGDAQLAGDLVAEELHVVTHPAGAVGTQVGEVLAQLGRGDAAGLGEFLAADRGHPVLLQCREDPVVDGQPGDGGIGDASGTETIGGKWHGAPGLMRATGRNVSVTVTNAQS